MQVPRQVALARDEWASAYELGLAVWHRAVRHELPGLAAELAFRFLHSVLWLFIAAAAISGLVSDVLGIANPAEIVAKQIAPEAPEGIASMLKQQLDRMFAFHTTPLVLSGTVGWLLSTTFAFMAVGRALDRTYETDVRRSTGVRVATSFALAIGLTLLFALLFVVMLLLETPLGGGIFEALNGPWSTIARVGATLVVVSGLAGTAALIYRFASSQPTEGRWLTLGALVYMITWLVCTLGLGIYGTHFALYANAYGLVGGLVLALTWFYLTALALLVGAEVNVEVAAASEKLN